MTIQLNLGPELETRLAAKARDTQQSLEGFIQNVLELEAAAGAEALTKPLTGTERARAFRDWAESFPASGNVLSLEDVSRENIYSRD